MEESTHTPERTLRDTLIETESDTSWLDAHADLIEKLESAYEFPYEAKEVSSDVRHYGFNIGELNLLIAENTPCEVLEEDIIYSVPHTPKWLIGVSNVRGDVVPIIDLEHILTGKITTVEPHKFKTCIIDKAENSLGLLLNKLPIPIHFKKENKLNDFEALPEEVRPFVLFCYKRDEEVWVCLDLHSLFESLNN